MADADGLTVVQIELTALRGEMSTGFARLEGKLNLISQAQDSAGKDIEATNGRVDALEGRVASLEARRWPMGPLTVLAGTVSAVAAAATYFVTK